MPAACNVAVAGYLTAIEVPLASMIVALLRSWLLLLTLLWLLSEWFGPRGLWMTVAVTEIATLGASVLLYCTRGTQYVDSKVAHQMKTPVDAREQAPG